MIALRKLIRPTVVFASATLVTAVFGSLAQTQLNLQALIDMGMTIELPLRMRSSLSDLLNFAPLWALIVGIGFILAFTVAWMLQRWVWAARSFWYPLAGAVAIAVILALMDSLLGITVIAAARTPTGVALLCFSGALGGWVQARYGGAVQTPSSHDPATASA